MRWFLPAVWVALSAGVGSGAEPLRIVTSLPVLRCFAANVAGDRAEVTCLLGPSVSPHHFALSPGDLKRLGSADVVITQGLGIDAWIQRPIERGALGAGARHVVASRGIRTVASTESHHDDGEGGRDSAHEHAEGPNPHTWLDPQRAIVAVRNIQRALGERDPAGRAYYEARATAYEDRLRRLDESFERALGGLARRTVVTSHDAFPYLADRYRLRIAGVFELFPGRDPTPREVRRLRQIIESGEVGALLVEPGYPPRLAKSMAADLGVPVVEVDPLDTGEGTAGWYEERMQENLKALLSALHAP